MKVAFKEHDFSAVETDLKDGEYDRTTHHMGEVINGYRIGLGVRILMVGCTDGIIRECEISEAIILDTERIKNEIKEMK